MAIYFARYQMGYTEAYSAVNVYIDSPSEGRYSSISAIASTSGDYSEADAYEHDSCYKSPDQEAAVTCAHADD